MEQYIINCKHCNTMVLKSSDRLVSIVSFETRCLNDGCPKKYLTSPDDMRIVKVNIKADAKTHLR